MRRARLAGAGVCLALLLGGCASLPMAGAPHQFPMEVPNRDPVGQYGSGPQVGSTPEQLISDFLLASAAGVYDDYVTARKYLLPQAVASWVPTAQVTVFPTDQVPTPELGSETARKAEVRLDVPLMATLDEDSVLHELGDVTESPVDFTLGKDASGEWRIASLEDGLVLSQSALTAGFSQFNVYFPSADDEVLVAEPRWVPRMRAASHLAQEVLRGPSELVAGAVLGNLAVGLTLPTGAVEVRDGVARVKLEGELPEDGEARGLFQWQMAQTLLQAPQVDDVVVEVRGAALDAPERPDAPVFDLDRAVALTDEGLVLGALSAPEVVVPVAELGDPAAGEATFPAVGPLADSPVAWVAPGGTTVEVRAPGAAEQTSFPVSGATKLSMDRFGNVWTAPGGGVQVLLPSGESRAVAAELSGAPVNRVVVSPDGARVAFLAGGARDRSVWVGALDAETLTVGPLSRDPRVGGEVSDIAWAGNTTVLALTHDGSVEVQSAPIGGFLRRVAGPVGGEWVSAIGPQMSALVQDRDQSAYQRVGAAWAPLGDELRYLSTAG